VDYGSKTFMQMGLDSLELAALEFEVCHL